MPLVRAINQALERLDVGTRRQRLFTANAAHELRTPVAIIAARLSSPREANFENMLKRDVWRISHIIQQLLAEARADETSCLSMRLLMSRNWRRRLSTTLRYSRFVTAEKSSIWARPSAVFVRSNKGAIEAVIANLVDNALRAEPEGGAVAIVVDDNATIAVIDHGPASPKLIGYNFRALLAQERRRNGRGAWPGDRKRICLQTEGKNMG